MKEIIRQFQKEIPAKKPSKDETDFSKTLEGRTFAHMNKCLQNGNGFEAYTFSWSLIDQVILIKLIRYIAKAQQIKIPASLWKSNQLSINNFYLAISLDEKLFARLEKGRKTRNSIFHDLIESHDKGLMKSKIGDAIKFDSITIHEIFDRLTGKTIIPSLKLYTKGWNDCVARFDRNVKAFFEGVDGN